MVEKLKSTQWKVIFEDIPTKDDLNESCMVGKAVKACPHKYSSLSGYDYLCFLDSKIANLDETYIETMIKKYFLEEHYALILRKHPAIQPNIAHELRASMWQPRYIKEAARYHDYIKKQNEAGLVNITKIHYACGVLLRNMKHEKIIDLNTAWYDHIQDCGIQDQISFFYVKQLFADVLHPFDREPFKTAH
jgi:hypothetical protein